MGLIADRSEAVELEAQQERRRIARLPPAPVTPVAASATSAVSSAALAVAEMHMLNEQVSGTASPIEHALQLGASTSELGSASTAPASASASAAAATAAYAGDHLALTGLSHVQVALPPAEVLEHDAHSDVDAPERGWCVAARISVRALGHGDGERVSLIAFHDSASAAHHEFGSGAAAMQPWFELSLIDENDGVGPVLQLRRDEQLAAIRCGPLPSAALVLHCSPFFSHFPRSRQSLFSPCQSP